MATSVNNAFSEFLRDTVNLDSNKAATARVSRDNLISNITGFSGDDDFFSVYSERNLKFGSFARHTKIQPLDDIDLMIAFSGEGKRTYSIATNCVYISGSDTDSNNGLMTSGTNYLNSTKVINRLISKISTLNDYRMAKMHKNQEAATLQLKTYEWNFDIVPCFYTDTGLYLIPDGSGNWKKTDPRIDNDRTTRMNQTHKKQLLDVIRLMKYWNNRKVTIRIGSYLLECMILSYYESLAEKDSYWVDLEFRDLLNVLSSIIIKSVPDPKGLQGDLNTFSIEDRYKISSALSGVYYKAEEASRLELTDHNQKASINKWREVFGSDFPVYTDC